MKESLKKELNSMLKNNKNWPIIIEGGVKASDFSNAVIIDANISSSKLGVINDINGLKVPEWVESLEIKGDSKTNLLVIDGIDKISLDDQMKFRALLHTKELNGYSLPKNLQIVVLTGEGNRDKINREILSLCLYYKA